MPARNIRHGPYLHRSWSVDRTVIAMSPREAELSAACVATQQAMEAESMARELGVRLAAVQLQVDANAAFGIIGRQGGDQLCLDPLHDVAPHPAVCSQVSCNLCPLVERSGRRSLRVRHPLVIVPCSTGHMQVRQEQIVYAFSPRSKRVGGMQAAHSCVGANSI